MSTTYDASTGEIRTNGELTHSVRICKFTGHALLYRVEKHWPKIYVSDFVESFGAPPFTDDDLRAWALHGVRRQA